MMNKIAFILEDVCKDLILLLMRDGMTQEEAFDTLFNSDTFESLNNLDTGLCFQSTPYIYDTLTEEIKKGKPN